MLRAATLSEAVRERARALGFDRVAIGPAAPPEHGAEFERWLDAGYAGTMEYLARGRAARRDPETLLPGARSLFAVALGYNHTDDAVDCAPVDLYARGSDY